MSITLVTGSARGLGLATATHLQLQGDRVHVVWRSSDSRRAELEHRFGVDRVHRADLEQPGDAVRVVEQIVEAEGGLDRVVHAVGSYRSGTTSTLDADDAAALWNSNVLSAIRVMDAARTELRASDAGRAIFFGAAGLAGLRARRTTAAYASAKAALLVLVRSWALEEAAHGLTVNMVSPGHVPHADAHADTLDPAIHAKLPAGRAGTPEEIARAVAWLLSSDASYTTGTDLAVGGGWML